MTDKIKVLISHGDPDFLDQVRALSDRLEIVSAQQVKDHPEIVGELEIVFGGLRREQMPQATRLRWLQTFGAGVNSLLTPEMRDSDLIITNASGIHAEPITEHMFGMLLMVTRRLAEAWDQQKTRQWRGYDFGANVEMLAGKTLGVLGVGAIGGHSARVGQAFGMRVIGLRRGGEPHPAVERMFSPDERLDFFRESDVVMNSLPLTDKTRHFMSWDEFAALEPGAIVINTGRGPTIDTEALLAALRENRLKAALLDVTDPEPLPEDHPLWTLPNVYITPHYSGSHPTYNERASEIFLENLRRYLAGEPLINVVDKREGY
ncbi:MAG: D-2-hydroxyacid dehydrogenase [Armatimonadota bacterium]|nr:D-2-hydroxyacid dehydrogenase [Armatimonadota bacterium]